MTPSFAFLVVAKATIVVGMGLIAIRLSPRVRASVRHVILASTFGVLLALPIAAILLPPVGIPILRQDSPQPVAMGARDVPGLLAPSTNGPTASVNPAGTSVPMVSASMWLGGAWCLGAAIFLLRMAGSLWYLRRVRRLGRSWPAGRTLVRDLAARQGIERPIGVLLHDGLQAPMTFGLTRPVIVLHSDVQAWSDDDLRSAVVHELEHIRRADWLVHGVARAGCGIYWFHPLVWKAWRCLDLEAERACDDAVLRGVEATAYADQLLTLARRLSTGAPRPLLSMASHSDLSVRVAAVLDRRQARGRVGRTSAARTIGVAAVILLAVSPLRAVSAERTPGADTAVRFETAAITRNTSVDRTFQSDQVSLQAGGLCGAWGRISLSETCVLAHDTTVRQLIRFAFGTIGGEGPPPPIVNGPAWIDADRFDVVARAASTLRMGDLKSERQLAAMVWTLLADRFQVALHRETRLLPIYALRMARSDRVAGPQLRPADADCVAMGDALRAAAEGNASPGPPPLDRSCVFEGGGEFQRVSAISMPDFAERLSGLLGRVVRDQTELNGEFAIELRWTSSHGSIFTALEQQLGLALIDTTGPVDVVVIDRASHPTPN